MTKSIDFQGGGSGDQQKQAQERQAQVEDMKNNILIQVLSQEARARCKFSLLAIIHHVYNEISNIYFSKYFDDCQAR